MPGNNIGHILKEKVQHLKGQDILDEMEGHKKVSVLFNQNRIAIFEIITAMPGVTISELARRINGSLSTVKWHINKLIEAGYVEEVEFGKKKGNYALEQINPVDGKLFHILNQSGQIRDFFITIYKNPGLSMKEIADALQVSYQSARWNVTQLSNAGLLETLREGKNLCISPSPLWDKRASSYKRSRLFRRFLLKKFSEDYLDPDILPSPDYKLSVMFSIGGKKRQATFVLNPFVLKTDIRQGLH